MKMPVVLAPFRTFLELKQPAGTFLIRLTGGGEDELPEVALFVEAQLSMRRGEGAVRRSTFG